MKKTGMYLMVILMFCCCLGVAQTEDSSKTMFTIQTVLCSDIVDREPVGESAEFGADVGKVYLWSKCEGAMDTTVIKHVWLYNGEEMAVVNLPVKSPMWRTWSSKTIKPEWIGDWEIKLLDADDNILKAVSFKIVAPMKTEEKAVKKAEPDSSDVIPEDEG